MVSKNFALKSQRDSTESLIYHKNTYSGSIVATDDFFNRQRQQEEFFEIEFCRNLLNKFANEDIEPGLEWYYLPTYEAGILSIEDFQEVYVFINMNDGHRTTKSLDELKRTFCQTGLDLL